MAFRVVKQLFPSPSSSVSGRITSRDPFWAQREIYVGRLSGSDEQVWEFSSSGAESNDNAKAAQLSGSDSSNRLYKVIEV